VGQYVVDSWVVSANGANSFLDEGLAEETDYYYKIYAFRGSSTETNYLTVNPLSGSVTTDSEPPPCGQFCERVAFEGMAISATWENGEAAVLWEDKKMDNLNGISLQRSLDGAEFKSVEPIWTAPSPNSKKGTDLEAKNLPTELVHYRIIFISGKRTRYSPTVSLKKEDRLPEVSITPNPASEFIVVVGQDIVSYDLLDATGRPLLSRVAPGQLSVKDLNPGLYLVRIYRVLEKPKTVKIIVHR
jgi:hypothetical protein